MEVLFKLQIVDLCIQGREGGRGEGKEENWTLKTIAFPV